MKNAVVSTVTAGRILFVMSGITLALAAVSCKTTGVYKPAATANTTRPSATNTTSHRYYTCGMHPTVRSVDPDGQCPICQMPLLPAETVFVVDPVSGKTNTSANFPAISGYYSCTMHPTVLSHDPDSKCPICAMPLLPVENPVFIPDK